jgi:inosose dehydratase
VRFAINPLQWDELDPDGVGSALRRRSPAVLAEVRAAGFGAVSAEPESLGGAAACRELLSAGGLDPAPGYYCAPLSAGALGAGELERARAFAIDHVELGLTAACLADDLDDARVRRPLPQESRPAGAIARIVDAVTGIAAVWAEVGLVPCIHNHVGTGIQTAEEIESVLEATAVSGVEFCPDTGHLAWAGIDPVAALRRHRDRVRLLHVKDVSRKVAGLGAAGGWDYGTTVKAGLWREPGYGDLDLAGALGVLGEPPDWVIVEVDHSAVPPRESTDRCMQWVRTIEEREEA